MRDWLMKNGKTVIIVFGVLLSVTLLVVTIWSFFRPAVKEGPWPPTEAPHR